MNKTFLNTVNLQGKIFQNKTFQIKICKLQA